MIFLRLVCVAAVGVFAPFCVALNAAGIVWSDPAIPGYYPLDKDLAPLNPLKNPRSALLKPKPSSIFADSQTIDFESRQITFQKIDKMGNIIWQYRYPELDEYIQSRRDFAVSQAWFQQNATPKSAGTANKGRSFSLDLELPVQYPSWAKRILGKDPPKLAIHGFEEVIFGGDVSKRTIGKAEPVINKNPDFDNKYELSVTGSVGRLINVTLKTSNAEDFAFTNPLKDIKLEYKGEGNELEDDIIQEVTAGYTRFELPSTKLSGYSESQQGLFGLSVKSKFGPVTVNTIISHMQAQSAADSVSLAQSASSNVDTSTSEKSYWPYKFYFLDTMYQNYYLKNYQVYRAGNIPVPASKQITSFSAWIIDNGTVQTADIVRKTINGTKYRKLVPDADYSLDRQRGYISFKTNITEQDEVGLTFTITEAATKAVVLTQGDTTTGLWFITKPNNDTTAPGYKLMWKNVYQMQSYSGSFSLEVYQLPLPGQLDGRRTTEKGKDIAQLLGLTDSKNQPIGGFVCRPDSGYFIIPPFSDGTNGAQPFVNPELDAGSQAPAIYALKKSSTDFANLEQRFSFHLKGLSTAANKTSFNLSSPIISGSDKVRTSPGNIDLVRDVDYRITPETGFIELLSNQAKASPKIVTTYQRETGVPDNKTFIGSRAELKLPTIGKNSLVGASILFQNASLTGEKIPRVGQEPYNKLLLDINTSIDYEPEWMTKAVNAIPLVHSESPSSVKIDIEAAHSITSPIQAVTNKNGEAYIDDFESAKIVYTLPTTTTMWYMGSPPVPLDSLYYHPPAWKTYWFEAPGDGTDESHRVRKEDVDSLTKEEVSNLYKIGSSASNLYESALFWETQPAPDNEFKSRYDNSWSSIMTWLPKSAENRTQDKFFEFYMKVDPNESTRGKLLVDLGMVSEDICIAGAAPNVRFNTEDTAQNGIMTADLNTGLDNILDDKKETFLIPGADPSKRYDTLLYGDPKLPDPTDPSNDNWKPYSLTSTYRYKEYANVCHLQGNAENSSASAIYANTEDINGDGFKRINDNYYRMTINLDSLDTANYVVTASRARKEKGWYLIRIPLNKVTSKVDTIHGTPSWERIGFVRMSRKKFGLENSGIRSLQLIRMQFVGSQWEALSADSGYKSAPDLRGTNNLVNVSVVNTEDDKSIYVAPTEPYLIRTRDANNILTKEQSLLISYTNVEQNKSVVARKILTYGNIDISPYDKITMLVHGKTLVPNDSLYLVLRFGTNDSTYYEYKTPIRTGWNYDSPWSHPIEIDLAELASQKLRYFEQYPAFLSINKAYSPKPGDTLRIYSRNKGVPSFSSIRQLTVGVSRLGYGNAVSSGEIWVDELKASGLKSISGTAAIASISTQWADFVSLRGSMDYRDGNFRTMTDDARSRNNSRVTVGMDGSLKFDKFLPDEWKVSIPVAAAVTSTLDRPQLRPGTDITLTKSPGEPDNLGDMYHDLVQNVVPNRFGSLAESRSRHYQTSTATTSLSTSYHKSSSDNIFINLLTERVGIENVTYQFNETKASQGSKPSGFGDYVDTTRNTSYGGGLTYDLTPRNQPEWAKWRPFGFMDTDTLAWLPEDFKRYEVMLLPSRFSLTIATINWSVAQKHFESTPIYDDSRSFSAGHGFTFGWAPISPLLSLDYSLNSARNLAPYLSQTQSARDVFFARDEALSTLWFFMGEDSRTQNTSLKFNPKLISWLDNNFDYTSNYTATPDRKAAGTKLTLALDNSFGFSGNVNIRDWVRDATLATQRSAFLTTTFKQFGAMLDQVNFSSISVTYTGRLSLLNGLYSVDDIEMIDKNWGGFGLMRYSLGFMGSRPFLSRIKGTMDNPRGFGGTESRLAANGGIMPNATNDKRTTTQNWKWSTASLSFPKPIDIQFSEISLDFEKSFTVPANPLSSLDTAITSPRLGISASSGMLSQLKVVQDNLETPTLRSSYSYSKKNTTSVRRDNILKVEYQYGEEIRNGWSPLVGVSSIIKALPISLSYDINLSNSDILVASTARRSKATEVGNKWSTAYTIEKSGIARDIKLLKYTISIKGRVVMGAEAEYKHSWENYTDSIPEGGKAELRNTNNFSLTPHVSYDFTDNVVSTISYSFTHNNDELLSSKTEQHSFKGSVRLTF